MSKNEREAYRSPKTEKRPRAAYYDDDFDDEEAKPQKPARKPAQKKKSHAGLWLLILVLFFGAVGFGVWYYREPLTDCVNRLKGVSATKAPVVTAAPTIPMTGSAFADLLSSVDDSQGGETSAGVYVEDLGITEGLDSNWLNILLLGADARNSNEPTRTDTMMILSIHRKTGNVKLASIMRDTAVSFEGYENVRLNSAYFHGGERLTMKTINEYFGMNIQKFVYVDFNGFAAIAEILGGIDMDISASEMDHINRNVVEQYKIAYSQGRISYEDAENEYYSTVLKEPGTNIHLNGMQTLGYARIRKLDSDYARAERQRKVLNKLMANLKSASSSKLFTLYTQCEDYFRTNLSMGETIELASLVLNRSDFRLADEMRLPVAGSYKEEKRNEDAMLYDMDKAINQRELYNFIYVAP